MDSDNPAQPEELFTRTAPEDEKFLLSFYKDRINFLEDRNANLLTLNALDDQLNRQSAYATFIIGILCGAMLMYLVMILQALHNLK